MSSSGSDFDDVLSSLSNSSDDNSDNDIEEDYENENPVDNNSNTISTHLSPQLHVLLTIPDDDNNIGNNNTTVETNNELSNSADSIDKERTSSVENNSNKEMDRECENENNIISFIIITRFIITNK